MAPLSHATTAVHELAVMESVIDMVLERVATPVAIVRLEIGELAGVDVEALKFCFGVCIEDTTLARARLEIVRVAGRARCQLCGSEQAIRSLTTPCACGSFDRVLLAGHELRLKDVEVW